MDKPITDKELQVMNALKEAWNAYLELHPQHQDHDREFRDGVHKCQSVIATRIVMRNDLFEK